MDPPDRPLYLVCRLPAGENGEAIKEVCKKLNLPYTTDTEAFLKKLKEDEARNRATNQSGGVKHSVSGPDGNQPFKFPNPSWDQENRVSNSSGDDNHLVTGPGGDEPFNSQNPSWDQLFSRIELLLSSIRQNESVSERVRLPIEQQKTHLQLDEEEMENEERQALESTRAMIENCNRFSRRLMAEKMKREREADAIIKKLRAEKKKREREAAAAIKKLRAEKNDSEKEVDELRRALDEAAAVELPSDSGL